MLEPTKAKNRLEEERKRIVKILSWSADESLTFEKPSVEETMPQSGDDEYADTATETFTQELDQAVIRRFRDKLDAVDAALKRLEVGAYGRCARCGQEIPEGRLQSVPENPYCIDCGRETESLG